MTAKMQQMVELSAQTARSVTDDPEQWGAFLRTAAWNYKYPFHDQLLLFAQRPDATACATIEVWNKRLDRWVKRGAKGIALIEDRGSTLGLRHVFDISDTQSRKAQEITLWHLRPEDSVAIAETLSNRLDQEGEYATLPEVLIATAKQAVEDNSADYVQAMMKELEHSLLEGLEPSHVERLFRQNAQYAVGYMLLTRCGISAADYIGEEELAGIGYFNTLPTLSQLGAAISDVSEMLLRELESTIREQRRVERASVLQSESRSLAKQTPLQHNEANKTEGKDEHGTDLHPSRGLSASASGIIGGGSTNWQVWDATQKLPPDAAEGLVRQSDVIGQAAGSSDRDRADPAPSARGRYDSASAESASARQGERADGMDGSHEQPQAAGGGAPATGTDLQLKWHDRSTEDNRLPFFHDWKTINDLLRTAPLREDKAAIELFFAQNEDRQAQQRYVRSLFKPGQSELILESGLRIGYEPYVNVLHLWTGSAEAREAQGFYDWGVIAGHIQSMLLLQEFREQVTLPTVEQQLLWMEEAEEEKASAFALPQAVIDAILQQGSGFEHSKYRIATHFQQHLSAKEHADYLKQEYGEGGRAPILTGTDIREWHNSKGITLERGYSGMPNDQITLSWMKVQKRIRELIAHGRYLTTQEKEQFPLYQQREQGKTEVVHNEAEINEALLTDQDTIEYIEYEQYIYSQGDTVFEDETEYEIAFFNKEFVRLRDANSPYYTMDVSHEQLKELLRTNPLNADFWPLFEKEPSRFVESEKKPDDDLQSLTLNPISLGEQDNASHSSSNPAPGNFRIQEQELGQGSTKVKFARNVAAIQLLKQVEGEARQATAEEQEILAQYVGWGGLSQAFDEENAQWSDEYIQLKELLEPEEYELARASTLNAHYTSPTVIQAMYKCLERMGFRSGNILEPACGTGNFFGLVPESFQDSRLFGVELDSITGRLAKQLYPDASITVSGFEKTTLPDSFFDLAIGNVPFGGYGVSDKKYDKHKFLIHDYFFAKTLDKVRPGGIIAFVTSKGTMDKQNPMVRKYIAERAELLGAIRLPNNAFLSNAGTEVTADILFLQKRDRMVAVSEQSVEWISLAETVDGVPINAYFATHPEMVLGTMVFDDRMYGNKRETACLPHPNISLSELLEEAMLGIHAEWQELEREELPDEQDFSLPADPNVRNFSYTLVDGHVYFRENSRMHQVDTSITAAGRIRGLLALRETVRTLMDYQMEDYSEAAIREQQQILSEQYDQFTKQYGLINSRANSLAFSDDSAYFLLCSLEILDEEGRLLRKADMFTKRTIRQQSVIERVDTAAEALAVSIGERACVDLPFMENLTGFKRERLIQELQGIVFANPERTDVEGNPIYETADAYLSGHVRDKLRVAKQFAAYDARYGENVRALEAVQPKDLDASEIDVRMGATWLPAEDIRSFMFELLDTPYMFQQTIQVLYSEYTSVWNIRGKNDDRSNNIKANMTYGTSRMSAYKIMEDTLNLRDVRIFDTVVEDGVEKRVLNRQETAIAQQKQERIKESFQDWIWKEPQRRKRLTRLYNERFNAIRPREYDGSHIRFKGMNPEIRLRQHQINAVARALYGGNALFAHCVGAGKTFAMTAAAMESKHLGLCSKSMLVVPNHLTEQWAAEFLQLYPSANILVTTKKDFEAKNRKRFCARIATGDYDAIIIGHSQFEKIPISTERQRQQLHDQIVEITSGIRELKEAKSERYAIKQLEKTKKTLQVKLEKLNDTSRKDDVVTFEELGVDRLFVDEADSYKNLFLYTKMRNVAGLSQTEAQKSSDMFAKCRYLDELTEGRGVIFATGTPISNSITEMYTMQRYLQYERLQRQGLQHFDSWASTFGETLTAIELAPEGTGYRAKTRFARFYNLPELMSMFKEVADIQTADMLQLPVPKAHFHNVAVRPSEFQKNMVAELSQRAEKVRAKQVEPHEDNMLKITNDGRKLALDQRLANPILPDDESSKVSACVSNVYQHWLDGSKERLTQLVFCDLSTPKTDGTFNVYDELKRKLIEKGVPAEEIAYIHQANTDVQKKELFAKVRVGQVRILLGSTAKLGAGTNVQTRLIALHDLDCPWRPRDLEQRSGRIIRQGNQNGEVHIFRYVTENTFDAYLYQTLENKQRFISQIMTSKSPVRSAEDIDETALSYAEVKALATGNPYIKEKMDLDIQVSKLKLLKANHLSQRYTLEDRLLKILPLQIKSTEEKIVGLERDVVLFKEATQKYGDESPFLGMVIKGNTYTERAAAGAALLEACKKMTSPEPHEIGDYLGFSLWLSFDSLQKEYKAMLRGMLGHTVSLGADGGGNITRLNNALSDLPSKLQYARQQLTTLYQQVEVAKEQVAAPFEKEQELQGKSERLAELNILLNMDKKENEGIDASPDEQQESTRRSPHRER
nr:helicase-related protein [Paenibacillus polymyxa]